MAMKSLCLKLNKILPSPLYLCDQMNLPLGEYTRKLIGTLDIPLLEPVIRSVSASISRRTSSKSTNFLPLQCKNSAYSETDEKWHYTLWMNQEINEKSLNFYYYYFFSNNFQLGSYTSQIIHRFQGHKVFVCGLEPATSRSKSSFHCDRVRTWFK